MLSLPLNHIRVQYLLMIATTVNTPACANEMINALCVNIKHKDNTNHTRGRLIAVPMNVSATDSLSAGLSSLYAILSLYLSHDFVFYNKQLLKMFLMIFVFFCVLDC